jgi:hypothetical protein
MRDDGERAAPLNFFVYVHRAVDSSRESRGNKPGNWGMMPFRLRCKRSGFQARSVAAARQRTASKKSGKVRRSDGRSGTSADRRIYSVCGALPRRRYAAIGFGEVAPWPRRASRRARRMNWASDVMFLPAA